ncbi:hypothetical protein RBSWK_00167 [Rhodopirellula baltica SWK14]|uniref:Uncharacterized protein n=1 Tax=Rhodopirellula baltica SWK14 TaxID=993516 RepID=L7CPZ2_RHOBT|nr:hypothetical protein RBSWK_00167 [Rhodopirellula baltica SWK14]
MFSFDELRTVQTKNAPPTETIDEASKQGTLKTRGWPQCQDSW